MKKLKPALTPFWLLSILLSIGPVSLWAKFIPPEGQTLLIIGQDDGNIQDYLKAVKIIPGGFAVYTSVESAEGLDSPADNGGGEQFAQSLIDRYPNTVIQMALYMVDSSQKVYSGDLDEKLDKIGSWIKRAKRPVYLRIGYEFDLPENSYEPSDYVKAFRYIVDRFRAQGIDNFAAVWHSYASNISRPHMDWYPGDDYVDIFAISYFDQPHAFMDRFVQLAKDHKKPLMIAESAPWHMPINVNHRAWRNWFVPLFKFIEDNDVRIFTYINCDWDRVPLFVNMGWGDTRVQSNPEIKTKWMKEISKPRFIKSGKRTFSILGFQP